MVVGFLVHTAAVLWIWLRWGPGLRGTWLVWIDLPWSLIFVQLSGVWLLVLSLFVGGAWWATLTAGLTYAIGRLTSRRR